MALLGEIGILVGSLAIAFAAAAIGGVATNRSLRGWYAKIRKPSWTPPGRTIGLVWSVLYALMAIAAWLVWRQAGWALVPLGLYAAQLALNVLWSLLFFGARNPGAALAEILVLWLAILATTIAFWQVSPLAGALLVPYLAWVAFASFLNLRVWQMNAGATRAARTAAPR